VRIVDAESQRILDRNGADCELSGFARDAMLGRDSRQFWPQAGARGGSRAEASPEAWATGVYQGRRYEIVIYRDAAERLAGEEARREAASLRSVNLLAQVAAHEIDNPLAIIMSYSQLLEDRLPAESEEGGWARTCRRAGGRIRDAMGRLNRIVRIESTESTGSLPPILDTGLSAERPDDDARR
jgi:signal transduction histidine kinase